MKNCYKCQTEIHESFKFCPHCGSNQQEIACPNCKYKNEPNSKFCQECGTQLTSKPKTKKEPKMAITSPIITNKGNSFVLQLGANKRKYHKYLYSNK